MQFEKCEGRWGKRYPLPGSCRAHAHARFVPLLLKANSAEVVEAVNAYAAVLMDCQNPIVDGFRATEEIRRREDGERRTPVTTLTAGVKARMKRDGAA